MPKLSVVKRPARAPTSVSLDSGKLAHRILNRARIGPLREARVRPQTLRLYEAALAWFFFHSSLSLDTLPDSTEVLDDQVSNSIELAWAEGESRSLIGNLLSGLQFFVPNLKGKLRFSWLLWAEWGKKEWPVRAPPFSKAACMAIVYTIWTEGFPRLALLVLLGYHRFMRTREFLDVTLSQCIFLHDAVQIFLPQSKTGPRRQALDHVHVADPHLVSGLRALSQGLQPVSLLRGCITIHDFYTIFASAVSDCGLDPQLYKPYGLRRGGATEHFSRTGSLDKTMDIGRWSSVRTAKIYVNTALLEFGSRAELSTALMLKRAKLCKLFLQQQSQNGWTGIHISGG